MARIHPLQRYFAWLVGLVVLCAAIPVAGAFGRQKPADADAGAEFFARQVKPILQNNCLACHSGDKPPAGLALTDRSAVLKGGVSGPAVSLTKPDESLLLDAVNYRGRKMPPSGKLTPAQIDVLTRWVTMGLPWEAAKPGTQIVPKRISPPQVTPHNRRFWSFQPVKRPLVPQVKHRAWGRTPIDAFILKRLESAGLAPNPPAGRATLIRRAYYDLIGLPPTPAQVQAFLNDRAPNAWEKVVDHLLADPHYGEKWGRHWLDLVRYAETNSYERDGIKPNAWRYRDYVIQAFNKDKPYNQFVTEQLAGDELKERTPEKLIATGYYRLGIWDDEPSDHEQALYDDLDDIVSTTGQVFLGLTVGCARCHDHKLDPIPQKDYYRFLSFFNGVTRFGGAGADINVSLRPIASEAEQQKQRVEIAAHEDLVKQNQQEIAAVELRIATDLTPVEKEEFQHDERRAAIVKKRVPGLLRQDEFDRYLALRKEREKLAQFQPTALDMALCVTEEKTPRETHVLLRGNPHVEGEKVEPGFLSILAPPAPQIVPPASGESCGRRLALARWIADKQNPLTARVLVNRLWQYHFGRGIVRTSSNFGFQGAKPTHPQLLDWLASELVRQDWKIKPLHKLILMSAAYRMSSQANSRALARDSENDLFWRFDMRRLEAEEVRDSILAVNGSLSLQMGGPPIYPEMPAAVLAGQSMPGSGWEKSTEDQQRRRSVYIHVKRSLITPILAAFDGPETDFTCPVRFATTQPTQALTLLNSAFLNRQARVFAAYLQRRAGNKPCDQVQLGLWRTLQRAPTPKEVARGVRLIESLQKENHLRDDDALMYFCVVALNLNEFLYLD